MKAVIKLDVPEWQIGQKVQVYFPDTMMTKGVCELESESVDNMEDRCVICGEIIPEGSHVCPTCRQSNSKQTLGTDYDVLINILRRSSIAAAFYTSHTNEGCRVVIVSDHGYVAVKFDKEGRVL